jgi:hypothetical protein
MIEIIGAVAVLIAVSAPALALIVVIVADMIRSNGGARK